MTEQPKMTRDQFAEWVADLVKRMPDLGRHLTTLPKESRDVLYEDIFSRHELRDALQMTYRMWESGECCSKWERDKLASYFIKTLQTIAYERNVREEKSRRNSSRGAMKHVTVTDPKMSRWFRRYRSKVERTEIQAKYKGSGTKVNLPKHVEEALITETWKELGDEF